MANLQYKLKKYTHKLRNAKNMREAEMYQQKLRRYHQMAQSGGFTKLPDEFNVDYVKQQKNDTLMGIYNDLSDEDQETFKKAIEEAGKKDADEFKDLFKPAELVAAPVVEPVAATEPVAAAVPEQSKGNGKEIALGVESEKPDPTDMDAFKGDLTAWVKTRIEEPLGSLQASAAQDLSGLLSKTDLVMQKLKKLIDICKYNKGAGDMLALALDGIATEIDDTKARIEKSAAGSKEAGEQQQKLEGLLEETEKYMDSGVGTVQFPLK